MFGLNTFEVPMNRMYRVTDMNTDVTVEIGEKDLMNVIGCLLAGDKLNNRVSNFKVEEIVEATSEN